MKKKIKELLEKLLKGYNSSLVTVQHLNEKQEEMFKREVKEKIKELEQQILRKSEYSCETFLILEAQSPRNNKILEKALDHFVARGFKVLQRNLEELGDPEGKYYILSWHHERN